MIALAVSTVMIELAVGCVWRFSDVGIRCRLIPETDIRESVTKRCVAYSRRLLDGRQSLVEVGDDVGRVFDAAAQTHQIDADAGFLKLFLGELAVRGAGRI